VAFTYDIYTTPSKNNGVLGATLTKKNATAYRETKSESAISETGSD
jgi:hypothetical protein